MAANDIITAQKRDVDPLRMISSPALTRLRRISLGTVVVPGGHLVRYLPEGSILTAEQREAAMRMAEALAAVLDPGGPDDAAAKMMSVRRLLAAAGVGIASRETGMGAIDGYMEALADIPAWAVEEARRRWLRAEAGVQDYDWAPRPPRLRLICLEIIAPLRQSLDHIRDILAARSLDDVLEERR